MTSATKSLTQTLLVAVGVALAYGSALALVGSIATTNNAASAVNQNRFATSADVYLSGGPQNKNAAGLPDGTYYFQVTDPSGKRLLSTDNASCRQLTVSGGRIAGASPAAAACAHNNGTFNSASGVTPVQLAPFSLTTNMGMQYKAWLIAQTQSTSISPVDPKIVIFRQSDSRTDNFEVAQSTVVAAGSCQPASSLSVLVSGSNVTSYVPKGSWSFGSTGISVVNVEGTSITPTQIPTANIVNSCASNSISGQTVCTANNTDIYLLSGTTLNSTLTSGGSGTIFFSGGSCTNCAVAMDATHNKAVIGLGIASAPGFQFLDLATSSLEPAFVSPSGSISEDPLLDPIRNLLLSASEINNYEIINVATTTSPVFYENSVLLTAGELNSSAEDCSTGIALAPAEFTAPSSIYIADLTQAAFTPGAPSGAWSAPSQLQTLADSILPMAGPSGIAVAQGTHTGIVSDEFGGDAITAIALPATSGSGTPAITDWVTCGIGGGFSLGFDPHAITAYQSPASGHAIGLMTNDLATQLAVVDLTQMLNPTVVPRTGNLCTSGSLPSTVVSFISVP